MNSLAKKGRKINNINNKEKREICQHAMLYVIK